MKAAAGAAVTLVMVLAPTSPAFAVCPTGGDMPVAVAAVNDGGTFSLADGTVVALAGIEPPRRPLDLEAGAPWPAGDQAREALAAAMMKQPITLAWVGTAPDRYGRRRAYVFAGGQSVEVALLRQGLAEGPWRQSEADCFASFATTEDAAIEAGRGIWALPDFRPLDADDPSLMTKNGLYRVVEGRVESVGHGSSMTFLDFGRNFRRGFAVMVPQADAVEMAAAGLSLDALVGRQVRVRGTIEESGGHPTIRLDDAAELEVIDDGNHGADHPSATR